MTAKLVSVGNGFILITSEEFSNGYQAGHLAYMTGKRNMPLSDEQLTTLFLERLEDIEYTSLYGIGFVVGWCATLANKGMKNREPISPLVAHAETTIGERE